MKQPIVDTVHLRRKHNSNSVVCEESSFLHEKSSFLHEESSFLNEESCLRTFPLNVAADTCPGKSKIDLEGLGASHVPFQANDIYYQD